MRFCIPRKIDSSFKIQSIEALSQDKLSVMSSALSCTITYTFGSSRFLGA
jgi:hypothetical protein